MKNEKYNGWSNYATWRVKLEIVEGSEYSEMVFDSIYELSEHIKDDVEGYITGEGGYGEGVNFAVNYALAFLSDVNWYEIAESVAENYPELIHETGILNY